MRKNIYTRKEKQCLCSLLGYHLMVSSIVSATPYYSKKESRRQKKKHSTHTGTQEENVLRISIGRWGRV